MHERPASFHNELLGRHLSPPVAQLEFGNAVSRQPFVLEEFFSV